MTRSNLASSRGRTEKSSLEKLKWVARAKVVEDAMEIVTVPGVFHQSLTHKIKMGESDYDGEFTKGTLLTEPLRVEMPSYRIRLEEGGFTFSLVQKPEKRTTQIGIIPQYHYLQTDWRKRATVCYGNNYAQPDGISISEDYRSQKSWVDKAMVAIIFLQTASPHYGEEWYRTAWAYRLGLVGEEVRDDQLTEPTL